MEYIINTFWERITTDPVAALLAGFVATSILIAIVKRFFRGR